MNPIQWYKVLAVGMLALPIASRAQGPQPKVTEIAAIPGVDLVDGWAVRMPNGRIVLFAVRDSITAYDLTTKRATPITRGWSSELVVSPQGDRLAYTRESEDGKSEFIWSVPIDPRTGSPVGPAQRVSTSSGSNPVFSPDGLAIAFAGGSTFGPHDLKRDLVVVPSVGGAERVIARYNTIISPRWSADGKTIFVDLWTPFGKERSVERVAAAGGQSQLVPGFSRDVGGGGRGGIAGQVAFYVPGNGYEEGRIAYQTASGAKGEFRIPPRGNGLFDSARAFVTQTTTTNALHVLNLEDGKVRAIPAQAMLAMGAMWSPDGKRMVFVAAAGEGSELVVMRTDGSEQRHIPFKGAAVDLFWSPDGNSLLYAADSGREIRALRIATAQSQVIATAPTSSRIWVPGIWQPDGKSFLAAVIAASKFSIMEFRIDGTKRLVRDFSSEFPSAINAYPISNRQAIVELGESRTMGPTRVFLVPLEGGAPRSIPMPTLDSGLRLASGFAYAANGNWLVTNILRNFRNVGIQVMSTATDSTRVVRFPDNFYPFQPNLLLADGRHVMKIGNMWPAEASETDISVYSIPVDGSAWRPIGRILWPAIGFDYGLSNGGLAGGMSPDGKSFAFLATGKPTTHFYDIDLTPVLQVINKR